MSPSKSEQPRPRARATAAAVAVIALGAGLGAIVPTAGAATAPDITDRASFKARGSINQAYVLGAKRRQRLLLVNSKGRIVARGRADRFGSKIFRELKGGARYTVRARSGGKVLGTRRFRVRRPGDNPPRSFFRRKKLKEGVNYVKMRDGVELAMTVRLPGGKKIGDGPFPTVVEHSGYQIAAPNSLLDSVTRQLTSGAPADPLAPAAGTAVGSLIAPLLDFAVVSIQMRGSGCSGGAFDLFDYPTTYDNYDAIESVAAQRWVKGGKVGMVGISFSGITQLFGAGTRPPHLAAISPMSVTDDIYQGTGFPGGIFNSGFARSWITERMDDAKPAPAGGQPYARLLIRAGDRNCRRNQRLRLQTQDALALQRANPHRTPSLFKQRAPGPWLKRNRVPTFLVGQFQDEQTSGHFPEAIKYLSKNRNVWITLQNGVHADSLGPDSITRWVEFLKLYVADEIPRVPGSVLALSGQLYNYLAGAGAKPVLQSRYANYTSVAAARADFRRDARVRLLMDNGAISQGNGCDRLRLGAQLPLLAAAVHARNALLPGPQWRARRQAGGRQLRRVHGRPQSPARQDAPR